MELPLLSVGRDCGDPAPYQGGDARPALAIDRHRVEAVERPLTPDASQQCPAVAQEPGHQHDLARRSDIPPPHPTRESLGRVEPCAVRG